VGSSQSGAVHLISPDTRQVPPTDPETSDLSLHFPLNTLALRRGGLVKSVLRRANSLAASGAFAAVWIEVLAYQPRLESDVARLRRTGHLHKQVRVRSVLYSLDPSPQDENLNQAAATMAELAGDAGLVAIATRVNPRAVRYLRDGIHECSTASNANGTLRFVDRYDAGRRRVTRDEYGLDGRLIRVLHYPSTYEQPTAARYIGRNGTCFLTVWQEPGDTDWSQVHLLAPRALQLTEMAELYQYAFEQLLAGERAPVLFADFHENLYNLPSSNLDDVVRSVRHPGLRTVAMVHSNHHTAPYTQDAPLGKNWDRLFANLDHWDLLVLLTDRQRKDVQAHYGNGARMRVIPPLAETRATTQPAPGAVDPDRLVLVARTHPKKRVDEALRAFRLVVDRRPSARLEIYGFAYQDGEALKIDQLVDELDLRKHLVFAGFTSRQSEIYDSACATLLTSVSEGFPLVLLESMAHGVPVIAYEANFGPSEAIMDDVNGYLVPFGDRCAMADRILSLMGSATLRERLGAGALDSVQRFGLDEHVGLWRQALADMDGPTAARSSLHADYEVEAARWLDGKLELHIVVPRRATSPQLVARLRGGGDPHELPVVGGRATVDLGASTPGDIFDFSLSLDPGAPARRLRFGAPDLVQQPPYLIYPTVHGAFSVRHAPPGLAGGPPGAALVPPPGQEPQPGAGRSRRRRIWRTAGKRLHR